MYRWLYHCFTNNNLYREEAGLYLYVASRCNTTYVVYRNISIKHETTIYHITLRRHDRPISTPPLNTLISLYISNKLIYRLIYIFLISLLIRVKASHYYYFKHFQQEFLGNNWNMSLTKDCSQIKYLAYEYS